MEKKKKKRSAAQAGGCRTELKSLSRAQPCFSLRLPLLCNQLLRLSLLQSPYSLLLDADVRSPMLAANDDAIVDLLQLLYHDRDVRPTGRR